MANLEGKLSQYGTIVMYTSANKYLEALNAKLKEGTALALVVTKSYLSKYEIIDELRTRLSEDYRNTKSPTSNFDTTEFNAILPLLQLDKSIVEIVATDPLNYVTLASYIDDLAENAKDVFNPPLMESFTVSGLEVYPIPQSSEKDPRRGARLLIFNKFTKPIKDWLINNAILYGFTLYQDYGLYYIGFNQIKSLVNSDSDVIKLINKFQSTSIPPGDILLKADTVQKAEDPGVSKGGCGQITADLFKDLKSVPENKISSTSTEQDATNYIINNLEGGYYHPVHGMTNGTDKIGPGNVKRGYDIMKNSGETLFGIDRKAGEWWSRPDGKSWWQKIDKLSGYGDYYTTANTKVTREWPFKVDKNGANGAWKHNYFPKDAALIAEAGRMIGGNFTRYMNTYFGTHPAKQVMLSDGRSIFMFYRAVWNGPGFFKDYANNVKAKYDSGMTRVEDLICADLWYRYEKKTQYFKKGVYYLKQAMVGF